ncbi:MAG: hypothetical protein Q8918_07535 [Bacteroidota bacterium]|nr:hypothetical protein [Bacteroidota bacterium]MDP4212012.1 hypothetical protein [Bacteroidota bacterium]MDP4249948.1 hypothetical protein [Bacteroidota bacterium]
MDNTTQNLDALQDIKRIMERSSRFISLSGWSGVAAGVCALAGAWMANHRISLYYQNEFPTPSACPSCLKRDLLIIGFCVFVTAFTTATLFTVWKSKKDGVAIWGNAARRLLWNTLLPMVAGGFLLWRMIELKQYEFIAPGSLIFYGLALINGSKYSMGEIRWLGYGEIILGIISLWTPRSGLICWTLGFGVLHILYGVAMWWKYDRLSGKTRKDNINEVNAV